MELVSYQGQRDMGHNLLIDLAYVGNTGVNEVFFNDINQAAPQTTAGGSATLQSRVFSYPGFGSIIGTLPWGYSHYNGLQNQGGTALHLRTLPAELFHVVEGPSTSPPSPWTAAATATTAATAFLRCRTSMTGRPTAAYPHTTIRSLDSTSVVWTLPIGQGHRLGGNMNRAWNTALGGWQTTDIFQARSGDPLTMAYSPNNNTQVSSLITISGRNSYRPNLTGSPIMSTDRSYNPTFSGIQYLNGAAYSTPPANAPFGNFVPRRVRGFAYYQLDTGLTKDFPITERAKLQFRAEAFNITNKPTTAIRIPSLRHHLWCDQLRFRFSTPVTIRGQDIF